MSRLFKGVLLVGAAAGAVYAAKNFLGDGGASSGEATLTFADGTSVSFSPSDIQGQEFVDIARKLVESGV
ncbi:hypothetical protein [Rubrobacter indicoceani]|uniref:hypothetical protein n=1 Tax=Rubrobacter indicoceani TaxID=2051957 RepID=UPI000E5C29EC|nr:hypothetical protein [Rubrobacter indicoceani]